MPLFGKKKKGDADETGLEVMDSAENNKGEVKVKNKGAFSRIKKTFRLSFKPKSGKDSSDDEGLPDGLSFGSDDGKSGKGKKAKKEKAPKAPKAKKEKKPKASGSKKPKESGDSEDSEDKKKSKTLLFIIIGAGALVVGAVAFFIISSVLKQPTLEEQLSNAQALLGEQKYTEAEEIFEKVIKKDDKMVDAYLGLADSLVGQEKVDDATIGLTAALEPTENDERIQAKLDEILNPPDAEVIANPAGASSGTTAVGTSATPGTPAVTATPVRFSDPEFEKMIRIALKKGQSDEITNLELAEITSLKILGGTHASVEESFKAIVHADNYEVDGEVYTKRGDIKTLNDLKYFTGLRRLVVAYNVVFDINGISELEGLETLGIYCNDIVDLSPLSSMESLKYLYIYNNYVRDLTPLSNLTGLEQLWLNRNNITDISPLKNLTNLTELYINDNHISDISAVSNLTKLNFLYFDDNQVTDISAVRDLLSLTDISFVNNPVTDTTPSMHVRHVNRPYFY